MVLFFKIWFFFFIGNLFLGSVISVLAADPMVDCPISPIINGTGGCQNPNTTFFASLGVNGSSVENPDTETYFRSQFPADSPIGNNGTGTGPPNSTATGLDEGTGLIEDIQAYFAQNEFLLAIGETFRFLSFINPFYTFDVMENMFAAVGIPIEDVMMNSIKALFFFLGILAFVFVILKIDVI